jgi:hypothetical protein
MSILNRNPYRILGVFANISESEILKQKTRHSRFLSIGKTDKAPTDFEVLGEITRTVEMVEDAVKAIEQPKEKLLHSLMWFINHSPADGIAFGHLESGDIAKAKEIWRLACEGKEISEKNFSSCLNLSTILIAEAFGLFGGAERSFDPELLEKGFELKGRLIDSQGIGFIADIVVDGSLDGKSSSLTETLDDETGMRFVNQLFELSKPFFNPKWGHSAFCGSLSKLSETLASRFQDSLTEKQLIQIKDAVTKCKARVDQKVGRAIQAGRELHKATETPLREVENVLGGNDSTVESLRNQIANQLLNCAITYFNKFHESGRDNLGEDVLELFTLASSLHPTGEVKRRLDENAPTITQWMEADEIEAKIRAELKEVGSIADSASRSDFCSELVTQAGIISQIIGQLRSRKDIPKESISIVSDRGFVPLVGRSIEIMNSLQAEISDLVSQFNRTQGFNNFNNRGLELRFKSGGRAHSRLLRMGFGNRISTSGSFEFNWDFGRREPGNGSSLCVSLSPNDMRNWLNGLIQEGKNESAKAAKMIRIALRSNPSSQARAHFEKNLAILKSNGADAQRNRLILVGTVIGLILFFIILGNTSACDSGHDSRNDDSYATPEDPTMKYFSGGELCKLKVCTSETINRRGTETFRVGPFRIDVNEVSQADFNSFLSTAGRDTKFLPYSEEMLPITNVTYSEAEAYCSWKGKRLPTEDEWEFAARDGELTQMYPWTGDGPTRSRNLRRVGTEGINFLIGNAAEWTAPSPGSKGTGKNMRPVRGGSYLDRNPSAFSRKLVRMDAKRKEIGFRCASYSSY